MAQANGTGDNYNVASFFMLKLLPPQNGTPAIEQKTDKKGRMYLVLHVRDCAGGGTYICNVFNNTGLADRVLSLNGGKRHILNTQKASAFLPRPFRKQC